MENKVLQLYKEGKDINGIISECGVSRGKVYKIIKENGVELRFPKKANGNAKKGGGKVCPHCKSKANPANAKFCCMCGADIRSEADKLIPQLENALTICTTVLPASVATEVTDTIQAAIAYLRKV